MYIQVNISIILVVLSEFHSDAKKYTLFAQGYQVVRSSHPVLVFQALQVILELLEFH